MFHLFNDKKGMCLLKHLFYFIDYLMTTSLVAQSVKNLPAVQETWV